MVHGPFYPHSLESERYVRRRAAPWAEGVVSSEVYFRCESWTIKKAERQRMDAFELWCWRRFLRVPWTARRSNQSILKEISPECSLERTNIETETPILWPSDMKN